MMEPRMDIFAVAPDGYQAVMGLEKYVRRNLPHDLFELVKLRASMINGCGHCIDIHSNDALEAGETTARLFGLSAWWEHPLYTEKERAALGLTDAATRFVEHGVSDDVFDAARAQFDERELVYLVAGIGLINMWNRFGVTFQLAPPSALTHVGRGQS